MYSGEYDACDVTLSVYPHRASLKNMPDHGGNRTYDLWNTSPMLCQLSYVVWSVRVCHGKYLRVVFTHALICFRKLNERASAKFVYFIDDTEFIFIIWIRVFYWELKHSY